LDSEEKEGAIMSWIDNEADRIEERDRRIEKDCDWAMHKANRLIGHRFPLWAAILKQVSSDVDRFNLRFEKNPRRQLEFHEIPSCTLTVATIPAAHFSVTAVINADCSQIKITTKETRNEFGVVERDDWIFMSLDASGEHILFRHAKEKIANAVDVSRTILKPLIDSMCL